MRDLFTRHPNSVGENYFEHMRSAFGFAAKMMGGGLACLLHGLFPFLFQKTGSHAVSELHERMITNRSKLKNLSSPSSSSSSSSASPAIGATAD